jgi:GNAT superfamily N-acetyltransferase
VLGAAFVADPVVRWLLPGSGGEARLFEILARHQHGLDGGTDIAVRGGQIVGASLWDRPGYIQPGRHALTALPAFIALLRRNTGRGAMLERTMHERRPPGTFWYLASIGALVSGEGIGSALLRERLRTVEGPAYLESSNIVNVPLYERFGFRVTEEFRLPDGGPTLYPMLRAPGG